MATIKLKYNDVSGDIETAASQRTYARLYCTEMQLDGLTVEQVDDLGRKMAAAQEMYSALQEIVCQLNGIRGTTYEWIRMRAQGAKQVADGGR